MITPRDIDKIVAKVFHIKVSELRGPSLKTKITEARHVAIYMCNKHLHMSSNVLCEVYKKKSHSTTLNSITRAQDLIDTDKYFRKKVILIETRILASTEDRKMNKQRYNLHSRLRKKGLTVDKKNHTVSITLENERVMEQGQLRKLLTKHNYIIQYSIF